MDQITVNIGGEERHLPPFRGFKAIRAGRLLARVTDQVQDLWDKSDTYVEQYKQGHTMRVTKVEAEIKGWPIDFPEGVVFLEYPGMPSDEQVMLHVFRGAFEVIEKELLQLLALVLAPNNELKDAVEDEGRGGVDGYLKRKGEALLHEADLGELVDVAIAARQLIGKEFEGKTEALADLRSLLGQQKQVAPAEEATAEETDPATLREPQQPSPTDQEPQPPSESNPLPSSTPSPPPTDGDETPSSSASPGSSYATSGTG